MRCFMMLIQHVGTELSDRWEAIEHARLLLEADLAGGAMLPVDVLLNLGLALKAPCCEA